MADFFRSTSMVPANANVSGKLAKNIIAHRRTGGDARRKLMRIPFLQPDTPCLNLNFVCQRSRAKTTISSIEGNGPQAFHTDIFHWRMAALSLLRRGSSWVGPTGL